LLLKFKNVQKAYLLSWLFLQVDVDKKSSEVEEKIEIRWFFVVEKNDEISNCDVWTMSYSCKGWTKVVKKSWRWIQSW
jgi:hypothetical protein